MSAPRTDAQGPRLLYLEASPLHLGCAEIPVDFWNKSPFQTQLRGDKKIQATVCSLNRGGTVLAGHGPS